MYDVMTPIMPYAPGTFDESPGLAGDTTDAEIEAAATPAEAAAPEADVSAPVEPMFFGDDGGLQQTRRLVADLDRSGAFGSVFAPRFSGSSSLASLRIDIDGNVISDPAGIPGAKKKGHIGDPTERRETLQTIFLEALLLAGAAGYLVLDEHDKQRAAFFKKAMDMDDTGLLRVFSQTIGPNASMEVFRSIVATGRQELIQVGLAYAKIYKGWITFPMAYAYAMQSSQVSAETKRFMRQHLS